MAGRAPLIRKADVRAEPSGQRIRALSGPLHPALITELDEVGLHCFLREFLKPRAQTPAVVDPAGQVRNLRRPLLQKKGAYF